MARIAMRQEQSKALLPSRLPARRSRVRRTTFVATEPQGYRTCSSPKGRTRLVSPLERPFERLFRLTCAFPHKAISTMRLRSWSRTHCRIETLLDRFGAQSERRLSFAHDAPSKVVDINARPKTNRRINHEVALEPMTALLKNVRKIRFVRRHKKHVGRERGDENPNEIVFLLVGDCPRELPLNGERLRILQLRPLG